MIENSTVFSMAEKMDYQMDSFQTPRHNLDRTCKTVLIALLWMAIQLFVTVKTIGTVVGEIAPCLNPVNAMDRCWQL